MPQIPVLSRPADTVADMTLRLDIVREIPALTGDMRPQPVGPSGRGFGFEGPDLVPVPAAFDEALGSES